MTVQAHDHAYASGQPLGTPLEPIDEPEHGAQPRLDQSLELIAALLPPALLLLSQLGPTHLFSPPLQLPALFETTLAASAYRKASISSATGSNALLSSAASIASTATGSTTSASTSFFSGLPTTEHLIPTHSHELHAPSTLSIPAVSAAAIWRLFRGFEWIGEVGKGEQPLPPSPIPRHLGGQGGGPPLEPEDDPEQVFDFPSLIQGVADVLAADAAARGIELVVGQVGSGSAPSPATTPGVDGLGQPHEGANGAAWSVALIWVLHHVLAAASSGSTVHISFLATAATPPASPSSSRASSPEPDARPYPPNFSPSRPQKWWTVSLEILVTAPSLPAPPPFIDETAATSPPPTLPDPPFESAFAKSLFALVQVAVAPSLQGDASTKSWALEALLPAARPKTQSIAEDPSTLLGRRRASLETTVGQEPSMNDLKRFAETALKGHKVALHAGETSAFARHLTTYLAGWGMDVQHIPIEREALSSGSAAAYGESRAPRPGGSGGTRFDSGFETAASSPNGAPETRTSDTSAANDAISSLVIIDDDVSTLRRLLVSLRAPPIQYGNSLMAKRPQLAARRTRSSPHVRQLHQVQQGLSQQASQWVIVHFASLTHYKAIKEIVQDTLALSKSPNLPEVLVVPKPAGPRRIITAIWTALKRPAVDPSLAPIATSPSSPGIQYWTPRLSPALAKEHEFDFSTGDAAKSDATSGATLGKPRTPPVHHQGNGGAPHGAMPPSPLGRISDSQDSYFSTVTEELRDTPSEGMIVQSPDGRSGIFFQPQPRASRMSSMRDRMRQVSQGGEKAPPGSSTILEESSASDPTPNRTGSEPSSVPPSRVSTAAPHEIGLGSSTGQRRAASSAVAGQPLGPSSEIVSPVASVPPGTPALALSSFITAAQSRANGEDVSPDEVPSASSTSPLGEALSRQVSGTSSARAAANAAAAAGAAAAKSFAQPPASPKTAKARAGPPKARRRSSRRGTLPAVPPISVLIVEDNPINQTILSMFMKKKGISYKVAKDGEQAVQMWKKGNFHLVLMDIQLPVKDGIEATREIREAERLNNIGTFITTPSSDITSPMSSASSTNPFSQPNSPLLNMPVIIVALTASSLQADRVAALAAGCNDFLTKPVSLVWLESKLVEWGSMAYLSGFGRKSDTSDTSTVSSTRSPTPAKRSPPTKAPPSFSIEAASRADNISAHLHIERPISRANSPSGVRAGGLASIAGSPSTSPEASPPTGLDLATAPPLASAVAAHDLQPSFTLTSPTPDQTPGPVPAIPGAMATPAPAAGGDAQETLDRVEEKLVGLVQEQEEKSGNAPAGTPQRPGPTPLPPSVVTAGDPSLDDVFAESQRLIAVGRDRSGSASFAQAISESGVSSEANSARGSQNSAERLHRQQNCPTKVAAPRDE
ncbi:hypothetical protein Rhopal_002722-T1 [Rhodotorula paludigena]|uniref:Response regulatory domain-containing protein n=1 Tax=Rhodotorula paludigena TaxID=86838 RepID=A0AAV5GHL5_9BASI|nr:hypothetical protein Rhopal_002722-T1 [Rhodotorula paludigena]